MGNSHTGGGEDDDSNAIDPEYQISLRKYDLTALDVHEEFVKKKITKPEPTPPPTKHDLEKWTVQQLCDFIEDSCAARYGAAFRTVKEVTNNFRTHLVDGPAVSQLRVEDWQILCPYIGPRIWLMAKVKEVSDDEPPSNPVPTPRPKPETSIGSHAASVLEAQRQRIQVAWEASKNSCPSIDVDVDPFFSVCVEDLEESAVQNREFEGKRERTSVYTEVNIPIPEPAPVKEASPLDVLSFLNQNPHTGPNARSALKRSVFLQSIRGVTRAGRRSVVPQSPQGQSALLLPSARTQTMMAQSDRLTSPRPPPDLPVDRIGGVQSSKVIRMSTTSEHVLNPSRPTSAEPLNLMPSIRLSFATPMPPPTDPQQEEPPAEWKQLLFGRSRFSNHRLIDTPWRVDPRLPWASQMWEQCLHFILMVLFIFYTSLRVGLTMHHLLYLIVPAACTTICRYQGWFVDFSPTIFIAIVVFPLTFSLNAAYNRREQALQILAGIKSSALSIYLTSRTWAGTQTDLPPLFTHNISVMIKGIFRNYGYYLTAVNETDRAVILGNIYQQYVDFCLHIDLLRLADLTPALVTIPFNNIINIMTSFEKLRVFSDYRTPCTIRSHFWSCMGVLAVLMGPYCANITVKYGLFYGYAVNMTFFWLLLCMNNIQTKLENPYSAYGEENAEEDDINLVILRGGGPSSDNEPQAQSV